MDPTYAERYRDLARRHWWWTARNACVREVVSRVLGTRRDASMLDIGCGDGVLFPFLSRFGEIQGIEPDPAVVSPDGPWRSRIALRPFDETFVPDRRFDLILMLDVLEHLPEPARVLRHAASLLEPGGHAVLTVPAFHLLWTAHDDRNHHVCRYTRRTLHDVVRAGGLEVRTSWYLFQWLFIAKLVERVRERLRGPSPVAEVPPGRINELLYGLSRLEQRLGGRFLPFGSSVLAVVGLPDTTAGAHQAGPPPVETRLIRPIGAPTPGTSQDTGLGRGAPGKGFARNDPRTIEGSCLLGAWGATALLVRPPDRFHVRAGRVRLAANVICAP